MDRDAWAEPMAGKGRSFWRLTDGFRRWYAAAIAALTVGAFLAYLVPLITRATIDAIATETGAESSAWTDGVLERFGGSSALLTRLWAPALVIALLALASAGCMYLKGRWAAHASEGIVRQLRNRLYDHLQHLPCRYHDRSETGDLVQRCTSDVETVRHFLSMQLIEVARALLLMTTVVPIMLMLDVWMTAVSLAGTPIIVTFGVLFFVKLRPQFVRMEEAEGRMTTVLQENLTGIRVVRAFSRQQFECAKFDGAVRRYRDHHYRLIQLLAIYWPASDVLVFGQQAVVLLVGAYRVSVGSLSVGTLVAFLTFVQMYIWPLRQMGRILADFGKAMVALGRIDEVLAAAPESEANLEPAEEPTASEGRIEFDHVTFGYDEANSVLHDVSFAVEPGQTLAILGPSGAGKSTIISLLLRLYDVAEGTVRLDGQDSAMLPRKWVRSQISVVMQEPFLYSKTVRENIALGRRDAEEHELFEAARVSSIHDAIETFDKGYDTLVGERGVTLSGGQRQRVALARALLQRPALLVLDDALSAVDTETETLILKALRQRHGRHTTIVIAHRLSTLRHADRILVLERGKVAQSGTHRTLVSEEGAYRRLWDIQGGNGAGTHGAPRESVGAEGSSTTVG